VAINKALFPLLNPDFDKLVVVTEIRPTASCSLSSKERITKDELLLSARTASRASKKDSEFEWLIARQPVNSPMVETAEQYLLTFEFNAEQHSWDYSWKSNRWVVDETHCFDVIVFKPDAASANVLQQVKTISSKPFTIFSARHIKKNNYGAEYGLSLSTTMTYAAATTSTKEGFVKKKSPEAALVEDVPFGRKLAKPNAHPKSVVRRNFRTSITDSDAPYAKHYATSRKRSKDGDDDEDDEDEAAAAAAMGSGGYNTRRRRTGRGAGVDEGDDDDEDCESDSSSDIDFSEIPGKRDRIIGRGEEASSSAAQALALAITGALVELGSEHGSKTKKRREDQESSTRSSPIVAGQEPSVNPTDEQVDAAAPPAISGSSASANAIDIAPVIAAAPTPPPPPPPPPAAPARLPAASLVSGGGDSGSGGKQGKSHSSSPAPSSAEVDGDVITDVEVPAAKHFKASPPKTPSGAVPLNSFQPLSVTGAGTEARSPPVMPHQDALLLIHCARSTPSSNMKEE